MKAASALKLRALGAAECSLQGAGHVRHGQHARGPTHSAGRLQAALVGNCGSGCCASIIHNEQYPGQPRPTCEHALLLRASIRPWRRTGALLVFSRHECYDRQLHSL